MFRHKSEQVVSKNKEDNFLIKEIAKDEVDRAVDFFVEQIVRHWPNTQEEVREVAESDFKYEKTTVVALYEDEQLIGTIFLMPALDYLRHGNSNEFEEVRESIQGVIERNKGDVNMTHIAYVGGMAVDPRKENLGLATRLHATIEEKARSLGYTYIIAHTAKPDNKYQKLVALPMLFNKVKMEKLPLSETYHYVLPSDLEKVWLYKKL